MIVRFDLLTKLSGISAREFRAGWRDAHGKAEFARHPLLNEYVQNVVTDRSQMGITYDRGSVEVDGISQFAFPGLADARLFAASFPEGGPQGASFAATMAVLTTLRREVVAPPKAGSFIKRMSFLKRRPDVIASQFANEWFDLHAVLVKRLPGILGYRQNLVLDQSSDGEAAPSGIDGIVELWLEDTSAIERAFRSPSGTTLMTHAKEFIGAISTFLVDPVTSAADSD